MTTETTLSICDDDGGAAAAQQIRQHQQKLKLLPDLCLDELFRQLPLNDQFYIGGGGKIQPPVCQRWRGLMLNITRQRRNLVIVIITTTTPNVGGGVYSTAATNTEDRMNKLYINSSTTSSSSAATTTTTNQMMIDGTNDGTTVNQIANVFANTEHLCVEFQDTTDDLQIRMLIHLLEGRWKTQLRSLKIIEECGGGGPPNPLCRWSKCINESGRLMAAIGSLSALKTLSLCLDAIKLPSYADDAADAVDAVDTATATATNANDHAVMYLQNFAQLKEFEFSGCMHLTHGSANFAQMLHHHMIIAAGGGCGGFKGGGGAEAEAGASTSVQKQQQQQQPPLLPRRIRYSNRSIGESFILDSFIKLNCEYICNRLTQVDSPLWPHWDVDMPKITTHFRSLTTLRVIVVNSAEDEQVNGGVFNNDVQANYHNNQQDVINGVIARRLYRLFQGLSSLKELNELMLRVSFNDPPITTTTTTITNADTGRALEDEYYENGYDVLYDHQEHEKKPSAPPPPPPQQEHFINNNNKNFRILPPQLTSVRVLELAVQFTSHQELDQLHIDWAFPNLEELRFDFDCYNYGATQCCICGVYSFLNCIEYFKWLNRQQQQQQQQQLTPFVDNDSSAATIVDGKSNECTANSSIQQQPPHTTSRAVANAAKCLFNIFNQLKIKCSGKLCRIILKPGHLDVSDPSFLLPPIILMRMGGFINHQRESYSPIPAAAVPVVTVCNPDGTLTRTLAPPSFSFIAK